MLVWWIQLLCVVQYTAYGHRQRHWGSSYCKADEKEPWSYRGKNGPYHWGERFPTCKGYEQSPIAIYSSKAIADNGLPPLKMYNYDKPITKATMENNGHTVEVRPWDGVDRTIDVNGDLYKLDQLHFHWGESPSKGSEHTLDGKQYSMEMHLVHRNKKDQIAVVAVFFEEYSKETPELQIIVNQLPQVKYKDMKTQLKYKLTLDNLLPANPSDFFRYKGSLTTPACAEGVTWSVLAKHQPIGKHQMKEFRKLYSATQSEATWKCKLSDNFRPVQPLNKRVVYMSK